LPIGVHPGGFDTWRWPELFALDVSIGAPPDSFFSGGQHWDTPPLHPERLREQGYGYLISCLRHHMRHARFLRVDHVMGLHRLYWIPAGSTATEGVYVGYPALELYAVLLLEARRHGTVLIGEDLGTVPPEVRPAMRRHGLLRTWVLQAALESAPRKSPDAWAKTIPRDSAASLNTHDMVPFAGFVQGVDVALREATGQLAPHQARKARIKRHQALNWLATVDLPGEGCSGTPESESSSSSPFPSAAPSAAPVSGATPLSPVELLVRALHVLGRSRACLLLLSLADLLLETEPQNLPGTVTERPNWRLRCPIGLNQARAWLERAGLFLNRM
ncbi:MAG: 4-alpha-glucanotransferase, partial [Thermoleophilia bacterium]|nr:4-alpha-glucanotransferase [Thermoleophilia bacterium]